MMPFCKCIMSCGFCTFSVFAQYRSRSVTTYRAWPVHCICEYGDFILHIAMCHVSWMGSWPTAQSPCILPVLW